MTGALERCFLSWTKALASAKKGDLIAIDGKTLRRSFDRASNKAAIHMISAWAWANKFTLGQLATETKRNEITAIPKLLELLDLKGCTVTIDGMGCQKKIARQITDQGGIPRAKDCGQAGTMPTCSGSRKPESAFALRAER